MYFIYYQLVLNVKNMHALEVMCSILTNSVSIAPVSALGEKKNLLQWGGVELVTVFSTPTIPVTGPLSHGERGKVTEPLQRD